MKCKTADTLFISGVIDFGMAFSKL